MSDRYTKKNVSAEVDEKGIITYTLGNDTIGISTVVHDPETHTGRYVFSSLLELIDQYEVSEVSYLDLVEVMRSAQTRSIQIRGKKLS